MAKPTLSQTQRNQALNDLQKIANKTREQFTWEKPEVFAFILKHAEKVTVATILANLNGDMEADRNWKKDDYTFRVCLLDALKLSKKYAAACKVFEDACLKKRKSFDEFVEKTELSIKYGENVDDIMAAFDAIKKYKAPK